MRCFAEGSWTDVMTVVGKAHAVVHQKGVVRVQSSMRVGTRYVFAMQRRSIVCSWPHAEGILNIGRTRSRRRRTR